MADEVNEVSKNLVLLYIYKFRALTDFSTYPATDEHVSVNSEIPI